MLCFELSSKTQAQYRSKDQSAQEGTDYRAFGTYQEYIMREESTSNSHAKKLADGDVVIELS